MESQRTESEETSWWLDGNRRTVNSALPRRTFRGRTNARRRLNFSGDHCQHQQQRPRRPLPQPISRLHPQPQPDQPPHQQMNPHPTIFRSSESSENASQCIVAIKLPQELPVAASSSAAGSEASSPAAVPVFLLEPEPASQHEELPTTTLMSFINRQYKHETSTNTSSICSNTSKDEPYTISAVSGSSSQLPPARGINMAMLDNDSFHESVVFPTSTRRQPAAATGHYSSRALDAMSTWLTEHDDHPYPTNVEVAQLAQQAGIGVRHVRKWLAIQRLRTSRMRLY